jgi:tRNA(fMet)-specific endonuclease VapC
VSGTLLLDTDVVSYLHKENRHAEQFREVVSGRRLAISFVTVAELYKWAVRHRWSESRVQRLNEALRLYAVLPYSSSLAWTWAEVSAACEAAGRRMDGMDAWVAACVIHYSIDLLTNNTADFFAARDLCGLRLIERSA